MQLLLETGIAVGFLIFQLSDFLRQNATFVFAENKCKCICQAVHFIFLLCRGSPIRVCDIVACAIDGSENCHIMGALPTGYGKSLPMLVTGLLMPPGIYVNLRTRLLLLFKIGLGNLSQVTRTLFIMFQVLLNNRFNSVGDNRLDSHSTAADERLSAVQDQRLGFKPGKRNI